MRNPDLYAQYDADCLRFTEQAEADDARLCEIDDDNDLTASYAEHLERRRDWNEYLAAQAQESAEYFGGRDQ